MKASDETKRVLQDIMCEIEIDAADMLQKIGNDERNRNCYVRDLYGHKGIYRGLKNAKGLIVEYCREFLHISDEETMQMARGERYKDEVGND